MEDQYALLEHNLTNHPPVDAGVIEQFEALRAAAKVFGAAILDQCPGSREKSLAMTNLEQSVMWAIAAIARNQES